MTQICPGNLTARAEANEIIHARLGFCQQIFCFGKIAANSAKASRANYPKISGASHNLRLKILNCVSPKRFKNALAGFCWRILSTCKPGLSFHPPHTIIHCRTLVSHDLVLGISNVEDARNILVRRKAQKFLHRQKLRTVTAPLRAESQGMRGQ